MKFSRKLSVILKVLIAVVLLTIGFSASASTKKHRSYKRTVHAIKKTKHKSVRSKGIASELAKRHTPPVGSEGEEKNDWFYRKRAWPNEDIDPEAYPRALEQARRMPQYRFGGKNSTEGYRDEWKLIGPTNIGGRVTAIATHPTDPNTWYVGAAAGGVWKTVDHGKSWVCVTDTFGTLATGALAITPCVV